MAATDAFSSVAIEAQVSGVDKVNALTNAIEEGSKKSGQWATEEERLASTVEQGKARQKAATQDLVDVQRRGADETEAATRRAAAGIDEIGRASDGARSKSAESSDAIARGVRSISDEIVTLKSVYLGLMAIQGAASSVAGLAATTDAYSNLIAKVKLAVGEGQAFEEAFAGIQDVALRTNASLEATGELFGKLFQTGKVSQSEALQLAEAVNQAVQLSGASAAASEAAVTQLILKTSVEALHPAGNAGKLWVWG